MSEQSGFFADVDGDRAYTETFLAQWISSFISNGVYNGELGVTAGDHMQVVIPTGRAWINGYHYRNDGNLVLVVANADGVLNRKDTVVLRWDVNARSITAQVIEGAPASDPVAPAIVRTVEQYDLKLAEISIPAGTTAITQDLITDTRLDNAVCGIVHGVVQQVDTTTLYNQIRSDLEHFRSVNEADFTTWVNGLKEVLSEDVAGNLLNMVNDLAGAERTTETVKGNADAIAALAGEGNTTTVKAVDDALKSHLSDTTYYKNYEDAGGFTDAYAINKVGLHQIQATATAHLPVTNNTWWRVYTIFTGTYSKMLAWQLNDTKMYMNCHNGSTWGGWEKVLTQTDYDQLFQFANDGKTGIANAVTAKGVAASPTDTFATLAGKIGQISTGKKWANGSKILSWAASSKRDFKKLIFSVSGLIFSPSIIAGYILDGDYSSMFFAIKDVVLIAGTGYDTWSTVGTEDACNIIPAPGSDLITYASDGFTTSMILPSASVSNLSKTVYWWAFE